MRQARRVSAEVISPGSLKLQAGANHCLETIPVLRAPTDGLGWLNAAAVAMSPLCNAASCAMITTSGASLHMLLNRHGCRQLMLAAGSDSKHRLVGAHNARSKQAALSAYLGWGLVGRS